MAFWYEKLQCECGQKFVEVSIEAAIYIYGVFFIEGEDDSFVGTTCPACLNTIYLNLDNETFSEACKWIKEKDISGQGRCFNPLGYFSPRLDEDPLEAIKPKYEYNIFAEDTFHINNFLWSYEYDFKSTSEKNPAIGNNNLYRTYLYDFAEVISCYHTVFWLTKNQIFNIIKYENEVKRRCIPRYVHHFNILKNIDQIETDFFYESRHISRSARKYTTNIEYLQDKGVDLNNVTMKGGESYDLEEPLNANSILSAEDLVGHQITKKRQYIISQFLKIISDSTPFIHNDLGGDLALAKSQSIDLHSDIDTQGTSKKKIVANIKRWLTKRKEKRPIIESFAFTEMQGDFIEACQRLSNQQILLTACKDFFGDWNKELQMADFALINFWYLKQRYFESIADQIEWWNSTRSMVYSDGIIALSDLSQNEKEFFTVPTFDGTDNKTLPNTPETKESLPDYSSDANENIQYAFYNISDYWVIIFNGESFGPIPHFKGLTCLHELVKKQGDHVSSTDLDAIFSDSTELEEKTIAKEDFSNRDYIETKKRFSSQQIVDDKYIKTCVDRLTDLRDSLKEAQLNNDKTKESEIKIEIDFILNELVALGITSDSINSNVKGSPIFRDKDLEKIKGRVAKNIRDTLKKLKKINKGLYDHFNTAIPRKKSHLLMYKPKEKINWKLHR